MSGTPDDPPAGEPADPANPAEPAATTGPADASDGGDESAGGGKAAAVSTAGDDAALEPDRPPFAPGVVTDHASPPWRHSTRMVAGVGFVVALLGALFLARNALTLVAMSGLIAFLIAPLIRLFQRHLRFPKVLALLTSYLVALAFLLALGALIVVGTAASFAEVDPAEAADELRDTAVNVLSGVRTIEIGEFELDLSDVVDPTIERLETAPEPGEDEEGGPATPGRTTVTVGGEQMNVLLGGLLSSVQLVGGLLVAILVTFIIALYLSADSHRFHAALSAQIPHDYARDARLVEARIGRVWRGYLYGQLLNSLATGLLVWFVLWLIGLPGAFVLGLIMMVLNMIPTFGPIIAAVPGVLTAIALGSTRLDWGTVGFSLLVIGVYIVVVQLQANVMAPYITGQAVQMSPAAILIGLIVGFQVGGLVGSLLVVPVLGTLKEAARYVLAKLLDRDPFPDDTPDVEPA